MLVLAVRGTRRERGTRELKTRATAMTRKHIKREYCKDSICGVHYRNLAIPRFPRFVDDSNSDLVIYGELCCPLSKSRSQMWRGEGARVNTIALGVDGEAYYRVWPRYQWGALYRTYYIY